MMKTKTMRAFSSVAVAAAFLALLCPTGALAGQSADVQTAAVAAADSQAKRIINDPLVKSFLGVIEAKFDVVCELPKLEKSDELIHWTCLNNLSCSYRMPVSCYVKGPPRAEKIQVIFSGFDSQGQNELQNVQLKHI